MQVIRPNSEMDRVYMIYQNIRRCACLLRLRASGLVLHILATPGSLRGIAGCTALPLRWLLVQALYGTPGSQPHTTDIPYHVLFV